MQQIALVNLEGRLGGAGKAHRLLQGVVHVVGDAARQDVKVQCAVGVDQGVTPHRDGVHTWRDFGHVGDDGTCRCSARQSEVFCRHIVDRFVESHHKGDRVGVGAFIQRRLTLDAEQLGRSEVGAAVHDQLAGCRIQRLVAGHVEDGGRHVVRCIGQCIGFWHVQCPHAVAHRQRATLALLVSLAVHRHLQTLALAQWRGTGQHRRAVVGRQTVHGRSQWRHRVDQQLTAGDVWAHVARLIGDLGAHAVTLIWQSHRHGQ